MEIELKACWCIGIVSNALILCTKASLHRVPLDAHSVALTSPLFEHDITLLDGRLAKWRAVRRRPVGVKALLRRTFFPLMSNASALATDLYPQETRRRGLPAAYADFAPEEWLRAGTMDWAAFGKAYRVPINNALGRLEPGDDDEALYDSLAHWSAPCAPYVAHRLHEMQALWRASTTLPALALARLSHDAVHDAALFAAHWAAHLDAPIPRYRNFTMLLAQTLRPHLAQLRAAVSDDVATRVDRAYLLPCLVAELGAWPSGDSIQPVSVKSLRRTYKRVFGTELEDATLLVPRLAASLRAPEWELRRLDDAQLHENTVPFVRVCNTVALASETRLRDALLTVGTRVLTPQQAAVWDATAWQVEYDASSDQGCSLLLLPLAPADVAGGRDLDYVAALLEENLFAASLLRPTGSQHTQRRVSRRIADHPELTLAALYDRFYDLVLALKSEVAARPLVVLVDAHLLGRDEAAALVEWARAASVRRLICVGAADTLPLHTAGAAFLDMARWCDPVALSQSLFARDTLRQDLLRLARESGTRWCTADGLGARLEEALRATPGKMLCLHMLMRVPQTRAAEAAAADALQRMAGGVKFHKRAVARCDALTLGALPTLDRGRDAHHFFVEASLLTQMTRNEVNHLLLEASQLTVLVESVPEGGEKWLTKLLKRGASSGDEPNTRYSLYYLTEWRLGKRGQQ